TLKADAQQQAVEMRKADVTLQVARAYYGALGARSVLRVAQETVNARQLVVDQSAALAASNLKSGLDVSFAKVNLAQAQLLLDQAQTDREAAFAARRAAMGSSQPATYELEDEPLPDAPPDKSATLIAQALKDRPDVTARRLSGHAALEFVSAERALW